MKKFPSIFHKKKRSGPSGAFKPPRFWHLIGEDPFVDWVLIVFSSAIVAAVLVAVGAYVYVDGSAQLSAPPPAIAGENLADHFDAGALKSIIDAFDARSAQRVLLDKAYSGPSDPSLP